MVTKTYTLHISAALQNGGPNAAGEYRYVIGSPFAHTYTVETGVDDTFNVGENYDLVQPDGTVIDATFLGYAQQGNVVSPVFEWPNGVTRIISNGSLGPRSSTVYVKHEDLVLCFLEGTMIATPYGEVPIETLRPGDLVLIHEGGLAPVKWLFVQTVAPLFSDLLRISPIRIKAGALGCQLPRRDLLVSADHALLLDGLLVQAGALLNGTTILRERDLPEVLSYYHVELQDHSLILAEGVPAETFMDNVSRRTFHNWREFEEVYGDSPSEISELAFPRVKSARQRSFPLGGPLALTAAA